MSKRAPAVDHGQICSQPIAESRPLLLPSVSGPPSIEDRSAKAIRAISSHIADLCMELNSARADAARLLETLETPIDPCARGTDNKILAARANWAECQLNDPDYLCVSVRVTNRAIASLDVARTRRHSSELCAKGAR